MPRKYAIYCDAAGAHYVLLEARPEGSDPGPLGFLLTSRPTAWLAFKIEARSLCYVSRSNLHRMQLVGHAALI